MWRFAFESQKRPKALVDSAVVQHGLDTFQVLGQRAERGPSEYGGYKGVRVDAAQRAVLSRSENHHREDRAPGLLFARRVHQQSRHGTADAVHFGLVQVER
jgi:hypothetical protein